MERKIRPDFHASVLLGSNKSNYYFKNLIRIADQGEIANHEFKWNSQFGGPIILGLQQIAKDKFEEQESLTNINCQGQLFSKRWFFGRMYSLVCDTPHHTSWR